MDDTYESGSVLFLDVLMGKGRLRITKIKAQTRKQAS